MANRLAEPRLDSTSALQLAEPLGPARAARRRDQATCPVYAPASPRDRRIRPQSDTSAPINRMNPTITNTLRAIALGGVVTTLAASTAVAAVARPHVRTSP